MPVYVDDEGRTVTTHSMAKSFRRCPKQAEFKYVMRLKPKAVSRPLKRGSWLHSLLQAHYEGANWKDRHDDLIHQHEELELFEEEIDEVYGDLPGDVERIMRSYLWHYRDCDWTVLDVEQTLEAELPDGTVYRCRVDLLVETPFGLYLVDHKSKRRRHDSAQRILDTQSAPYVWAARQNDIPVEGFIWNYLPAKPPTEPEVLKDGSRLSRRQIVTDYPTMRRAVKQAGLDLSDYGDELRELKQQRFRSGEVQTSPFFQRVVMERDDKMLERMMAELLRTSQRLHSYYDEPGPVERVVEQSCNFSCDFERACTAELIGGNVKLVIRSHYDRGADPLEYYEDDREDEER